MLFAGSIAWLMFGPFHPRLKSPAIALAGIALIVLGAAVEGWRWQMLPAQLGFAVLMLASMGQRRKGRLWRMLGPAGLTIVFAMSAFLALQLPVLSLPSPRGEHAVGTFELSVTDLSRSERFSPDRNRELYIEVWYPADTDGLDAYPVRSLYHELSEGDPTFWSFLFRYFRLIPTHSHVEAAPAAPGSDRFPVLLFNHGLDGFTSQNQLLMEHLASHGYVVFSIGHPYESIRVNLDGAGTIRSGTGEPSDIDLPLDEMDTELLSRIIASGESLHAVSPVRAELFRLSDAYSRAEDDPARAVVVSVGLQSEELAPYSHLMSEKSLADYLLFLYVYQGRSVEYWVEDIRFVANALSDLDFPIDEFATLFDSKRLGVFGMSIGGAAAGEFCKIDSRCSAGANIDGTQGGRHWDTKVGAPFMMIYHEEHQGGNDFAYVPPSHDLWDFTITGTTHFDFVEIAYTLPLPLPQPQRLPLPLVPVPGSRFSS